MDEWRAKRRAERYRARVRSISRAPVLLPCAVLHCALPYSVTLDPKGTARAARVAHAAASWQRAVASSLKSLCTVRCAPLRAGSCCVGRLAAGTHRVEWEAVWSRPRHVDHACMAGMAGSLISLRLALVSDLGCLAGAWLEARRCAGGARLCCHKGGPLLRHCCTVHCSKTPRPCCMLIQSKEVWGARGAGEWTCTQEG